MKKRFSVLLAIVLSFAMVTNVFANAPITGEVVGGGDAFGADDAEHLFNGVVPTAAHSLDFVIDPQGLLALAPGATFDPSAPRNNAITFANPVLRAYSTSTELTLMSVSLRVTGSDGTGNHGGAELVETAGAVTNGVTRNALFWAEPSEAEHTAAGTPFVGIGYVIPITGTAGTLWYRFGAVGHEVYVQSVTGNVGDPDFEVVLARRLTPAGVRIGTAIELGGIVNEAADWSDATVDIGIAVVFTLQQPAAGDTLTTALVSAGTAGPVPNLVQGHDDAVTLGNALYQRIVAPIERPDVLAAPTPLTENARAVIAIDNATTTLDEAVVAFGTAVDGLDPNDDTDLDEIIAEKLILRAAIEAAEGVVTAHEDNEDGAVEAALALLEAAIVAAEAAYADPDLLPVPPLGFIAGGNVTGVNNNWNEEYMGSPMVGVATVTFTEGDIDGQFVPFAFDTNDYAETAMWLGEIPLDIWFTVSSTGITFTGTGWDETPAGDDPAVFLVLEDGTIYLLRVVIVSA